MMSLFSIFDPSMYSGMSPWLAIFIPLFFLFSFNNMKSGLGFYFSAFINSLASEFSSVIKTNIKKGSVIFIYSSFFFIFLLNFIALFPSIFTVSGHLMFSLGVSLIFWCCVIIFSMVLNFSNFMSHLVPLGTPTVLMSFMVLVELVSSIIRPITLSVRLAANMVAGHLLMSLLGSFILSFSVMGVILFSSVGLVLTILELAVSFIQGYVFLTLFSLYSEESH